MKTTKVLVIDDEPLVRRSTHRLLTDEGYEVLTAETAAEGAHLFEANRPHVVILDVKLPDGSGLDVLQNLRRIDPGVQVVMITAFGETQTAVRAMKLGATDFLKKPYDLEEMRHAVRNAAKSRARDAQLKVYRKRDRARYARSQMIGRCPGMQHVRELARKVARSDATNVLVTGESGTGKELVARAIHFESGRRNAPLMEINCSGFQESLLENELFGHERGAYTGANYLKRGLVELCDEGTLFLDEVAEMPLSVQAKLLRFMDHQTFRRVGGNVDLSVDIRVVAATNADLERRIEEGRFRQDLFFRLKVVSIHLPPLRDRGDDVLELAAFFLDRLSQGFGKDFRTIDLEASRLLRRYAWPGNVRELENLLERVVLLEQGPVLRAKHLPPGIRGPAEAPSNDRAEGSFPEDSRAWFTRFGVMLNPAPDDSPMSLREFSDAYIRFVLAECDGNRTRTARRLGLSRQGLIDRLRRMERRRSDLQPVVGPHA